MNLEAEVEPGIANQARCLRLVVFVPTNTEAYSYGVVVPSSNRANVSRLKRMAELQRAERDKILNLATRTRMSVASVSGTDGSNPACSSRESVSLPHPLW